MAGHYVYIIQQQGKGPNAPLKIGYSKDPDERLKTLQTGSPYKLKVCTLIECESEEDGRKLERTLHWLAEKRFKKLAGEWFVVQGSWGKLIKQAFKLCRIERPQSCSSN